MPANLFLNKVLTRATLLYTHDKRLLTLGAAISLLAIFATYWLLYKKFFPNYDGELGYDYNYVLPHLLVGYYQYLNEGLFSTPWFSPHACGGFVAAAHPHSFYFSIYQLLTFFTQPTNTTYYSFFIFAAIGQVGFYVLMRRVFNTSITVALATSTLFLFNSFYTFRLVIGHMTFHGYMLLPWLIAIVFIKTAAHTTQKIALNIALGITFGVLCSYIFLSGGVHITIPIGLSVIGIYAFCKSMQYQLPDFWLRLCIGLLVAIILSGTKLSMAMNLIQHVDRSLYDLPGFTSLWDQLVHLGYALFFEHPVGVYEHLANYPYRGAKFEWEFSVGIMPLLCLPPLAIYQLVKNPTSLKKIRIGLLCLVLVILALPLAVNFHTPAWQAVLQQIPIIKNSSLLFRWYSIYIPFLIIFTAFLLQAFPYRMARIGIAGMIILGTISCYALRDNTFYHRHKSLLYEPQKIDAAYLETRQTGAIPAITMIGQDNDTGRHSLLTTDLMLKGISALNCYEPLFGYGNEALPKKSLHLGPATALKDGVYNMKNPACYVFPQENQCEPGDHFTAGQKTQLDKFLRYQTFEFATPTYHKVITIICLSGWFICMGYLIVFSLYTVSNRFAHRHA